MVKDLARVDHDLLAYQQLVGSEVPLLDCAKDLRRGLLLADPLPKTAKRGVDLLPSGPVGGILGDVGQLAHDGGVAGEKVAEVGQEPPPPGTLPPLSPRRRGRPRWCWVWLAGSLRPSRGPTAAAASPAVGKTLPSLVGCLLLQLAASSNEQAAVLRTGLAPALKLAYAHQQRSN